MSIGNLSMKEVRSIYRGRYQRYSRVGATPKFIPGEQIGKFTIIEYIGYSTVHPGTAKILSREHHWYRCKCACGVVEIKTQQQLTDKRRVHACTVCLKEIKEFTNDSSSK